MQTTKAGCRDCNIEQDKIVLWSKPLLNTCKNCKVILCLRHSNQHLVEQPAHRLHPLEFHEYLSDRSVQYDW